MPVLDGVHTRGPARGHAKAHHYWFSLVVWPLLKYVFIVTFSWRREEITLSVLSELNEFLSRTRARWSLQRRRRRLRAYAFLLECFKTATFFEKKIKMSKELVSVAAVASVVVNKRWNAV